MDTILGLERDTFLVLLLSAIAFLFLYICFLHLRWVRLTFRLEKRCFASTITVEAAAQNGAVHINWECTGTEGLTVFGYRYPTELPQSTDDAGSGGIRIVNQPQGSGTVEDHIEPATTAYYSFHLETRLTVPVWWKFWDGAEIKIIRTGFTTFSVRIPKTASRATQLEKQFIEARWESELERLVDETKTEIDRRRELEQTILKRADGDLQAMEELEEKKKEWIGKVENNSELSDAEKHDRIEDIEDKFQQLKDHLAI